MPAAVREGHMMQFPIVGRTGGLLLAVGMLLAACSERKPTPPPPEAGYIVLKTETVPLFIELAGRTAAYETSEVRPQVSGIVKARLFEEGSIVRAGQTLYRIDPRLYRAALNQAAANLDNARAQREAAAARASRLKPLAQIEAVSKQDYTDASAAAKQASAAVAQNAAQLETARINLRFTDVPAPISGRIGRSLVTTGALVTTGQADPLTTIQRLDPIFVDIQQSSADLLALRRQLASGGGTRSSAAVTLKLEDGSEYGATGRLEFTEAMVDPATGTVTLRARFPNPQGLLLPGMYVRANLSQITARDAILVPQAGLTRNPKGEATVMLVGKDGKAELRSVTAANTVGDKWLVTTGLKPGDKLIVEGLGRIKPGQPIRPVPAGSPPAARKAG
ncbi:efflux RND transporter periplasmic adaptor subunit [Sphingomonadaceae bacterium G21617-S1]|uniref:efflux RND transporter periplasmic adaptor subunit n=1 Tax=Rhizorhabdus sp. TaxID=1968843 RepID=UPI0019999972|nr:efflux RND transporter periplasmic adaptor subunit [Rhizorhabdus sp.]MBD3759812.1 efflux RND transporter periplasmic adaptor subunit [Rhizorhabdus sp.]MCZ4342193.1 efflux RND transporter periplasmic adaptor subunit [Sphingomonadaceae bacterium G21617-S1]